ncbi:MAG: ABC transporter permease, partial [Desulfitobacteriaceae bacterium]|nr:ABC transporter permease [Desulfitobacteriaceae bacterium]
MQLPQELFMPLGKDDSQSEMIVRPSETYWQDAWRRLKQNKLAICGLAVIAVLAVLALVGPWLTPFSYSDQILALKNKPPGYTFYVKIQESNGSEKIVDFSEEQIEAERGFRVEKRCFWFGSDSLGRDLFTRNWYGARISLTIGLVTALLVFMLGTVYGGISGYLGGWTDEIMMRVVEILSAIPFLLYVILLMVLMEPGLKTIFIALGAVYWLPMARLVRGQILALKEQDYIVAARALGAGTWRILFRHLIPNTMGPIMVYVTLAIP